MVTLLTGAVMAWGENIDASCRSTGKLIVGLCVPFIVWIGLWDLRRLRRRDVMPDVLGQTVVPESIYDVGAAHFF